MEEEKKVEEPIEDTEEDEEKTSTDLIEKANAAAERLETANKTLEKNITRQEALQVEKTLGGQAEVATQKLDETPQEYAKRVMSGDFNSK